MSAKRTILPPSPLLGSIPMHTALNYVDGEWQPAHPSQLADSFNPATGEIAAQFICATIDDAEQAVQAARSAFEQTSWAQQPQLRADVLRLFADRLEARQADIVQSLVTLNGKLKREAEGELRASISEIRYYSGLARNLFGRTIELEPQIYSLIDREAIGVAAIIVPWNAPVTLLIRSLAPALAAGCSVVIKAAWQTAWVHHQVMECLVADDRIPKGIVNSLVEREIDATQHLCAHQEIDVISFTGSTRVGKQIAAATAKNLTRLSLELGGKAPAIVLPDADLDGSVKGIIAGATVMAGQMCTAISRILVHESVASEFQHRLSAALSELRVGPGHDPASMMGPVIDCANRNRLLSELEAAQDQAEVLLAGGVPEHLPKQGAFITPSLLGVSDVNSRLVQTELFGPLLTYETFGNLDEAVEKANATRYGLASSIWTQDYRLARRLSRRLKFGNVWLNTHNRLFAEIETGGFRESGIGRLHGVEGLNDFLETKHVFMPCD